MITIKDLTDMFAEKLKDTGNMHDAMVKALWRAYRAGYEDGQNDEPSAEFVLMPNKQEWRNWEGGERPVPFETRVDVEFRNGNISNNLTAGRITWLHGSKRERPYEVVKWRVSDDD